MNMKEELQTLFEPGEVDLDFCASAISITVQNTNLTGSLLSSSNNL